MIHFVFKRCYPRGVGVGGSLERIHNSHILVPSPIVRMKLNEFVYSTRIVGRMDGWTRMDDWMIMTCDFASY